MKNSKLLIFLFLVLINIKSNAQTIVDLSAKVCDSIKTHSYTENDTIEITQGNIYAKFLTDYVQKTSLDKLDLLSNFNTIGYKLNRELHKTCVDYKSNSNLIFPLTTLVDVESIYSTEQRKTIEVIAKEIRNKNRMQVLVLSIDEIDPNQDIVKFSFDKIMDWKIGGAFEKGGAIIVFSKKLKLIRISTTEKAMKYLTDKNCDEIVSQTVIPNFKKDDYFTGIYNSLVRIRELTK